jgi:hypothetical protein
MFKPDDPFELTDQNPHKAEGQTIYGARMPSSLLGEVPSMISEPAPKRFEGFIVEKSAKTRVLRGLNFEVESELQRNWDSRQEFTGLCARRLCGVRF